jgi:hypothetical protein
VGAAISDSPIDPSLRLTPGKNIATIAMLAVSFITIGGLGSASFCSIAAVAPGLESRLFFVVVAIYLAIMLALHVVGYRLWRRQFFPPRALGQPPGFLAVAVLTVSYILIGGLGSAGLYWAVRDMPGCSIRFAFGRALVFAVTMLFVHVVGYLLWKRQFSADRGGGHGLGLAAYGRPIKTALLQQGIFLILAALALDMGETWHTTLVAVLAYWMSAGVIVARRPDSPTRTDLFFIRWGFLVIWLIVVIVGPMAWYCMAY